MSEHSWIDRYIRPLVKSEGADGLLDDVAQLDGAGVQIATMDTLVEGVHFLPGDAMAGVGQKLIRVNVSDILAKGARPHEALLSIAWPRAWPEAQFGALMAGIGADLKTYEIALLGGDLVKTDGPLVATLTLTGRCQKAGPVRRLGGAKPDDEIWVSGQIGWSVLGLEAAKAGEQSALADRYRIPRPPPLPAADIVAEHARASMDVSDGLLIDLERLVEVNGRGAVLQLEQVPLARPDCDVALALHQATGGDDYQILMITPPGQRFSDFTKIGRVTKALGLSVTFHGAPVNLPETLGFEH
ncbi:MAG: thiamine-phosphate kinase [Pseudomonadota bacterium]